MAGHPALSTQPRADVHAVELHGVKIIYKHKNARDSPHNPSAGTGDAQVPQRGTSSQQQRGADKAEPHAVSRPAIRRRSEAMQDNVALVNACWNSSRQSELQQRQTTLLRCSRGCHAHCTYSRFTIVQRAGRTQIDTARAILEVSLAGRRLSRIPSCPSGPRFSVTTHAHSSRHLSWRTLRIRRGVGSLVRAC